MSVDIRQLLEVVVRPALRVVAIGHPGAASEAAERLILGTGAVESDYRALRQRGGGPALGFWQCEPATYRDLWANYLAYKPDLALALKSLASSGTNGGIPPADEMCWNLRFAAAMCRCHYLRDPHKLPDAIDIKGQAMLWKRHYNTALGAGKPEHYLNAYYRLIQPALAA